MYFIIRGGRSACFGYTKRRAVHGIIPRTPSSQHQAAMTLSVLLSVTCLVGGAATTGPLNGLPVLNGPINPVPKFDGMKTRVGDFTHPGIWHTHDDLERIRIGVEEDEEPWKTAYQNFSLDSYSQAGYQMQGPESVISRGSPSNYTSFAHDARAAYQNALMWYITKNQSHWNRATTILDAWGGNLTSIIGTDTALLVGLDGDIFVNAAEIMRWEGNWTEAGAKASGGTGFSNQLYWLFARQSIIIGQANYGMVSIKALLSFAVYLDDVSMYNYALYAYQNDLCAGLYGNFDTKTGQGAETGRDQGHATGALGWAAEAARTVQSQGVDIYSLDDNLLLRAAEYTARYNLGDEVAYDPKFYRCEAILINGPWSAPSNISRGASSSPQVWDILYYQYAIKRNLSAPYTSEMKAAIDVRGGEGSSSSNDHPSWGDLIWSYPGPGSYKNGINMTISGGGSIGPDGLGNLNSA
ncbi:chondroitin AC/alginate lyase [Xylariaceae sp. FL0016]|nr:chondroitin AC/alginate lyase [Xylariaceae sp. FL0016]